MRIVNPEAGWIDYRLHILGVRVREQSCQLVAKSGEEWIEMGPRWDLPVTIPASPADLNSGAVHTLHLTAYQYDMENPGTDLRVVLGRQKDFQTALTTP